jgi:hypothetical protein
MSDDNNDRAPIGPLQLNDTVKLRRFTQEEKMGLVRSISTKIETTYVSIKQACNDANIHHKQCLIWKQVQLHERSKESEGDESLPWSSVDHLLFYIFELREHGIGVKTDMVMRKVSGYTYLIILSQLKPTSIDRDS